MEMTSQFLHFYSPQQLQPTSFLLPVSVQRLTYEDDDIIDAAAAATAAAADDDDDNDDAGAHNRGPQTVSVNSAEDHCASSSANVSHSVPV